MDNSGTLNYAIIRLLTNQIAAFWSRGHVSAPIVLHSRTLIIHEQLAGVFYEQLTFCTIR